MNKLISWPQSIFILLIVSCVLMYGCQRSDKDPSQSPPIIRSELIKVMQIDPVLFSVQMPAETRQHLIAVKIEKHHRLLEQLAKLEANRSINSLRKAAGDNINDKLSLIAVDRARNPLIHARIAGRYLLAPPSESVRQGTPYLDPNDISEETRLAWEYLLLLPYGYDGLPGYIETALEAVARIGNPASVPTLLAFANKTNGLPVKQYPIIKSYYELAAASLLHIPSAQSAAALQKIYQQAKTLRAQEYPFPVDWPEAVIFDYFDDAPQEINRQWRDLSRQFSDDRLFVGIQTRIDERPDR